MGLPVERLIIGSNRNDILARFFCGERHAIRAGRADHSAQHGHPGRSQFRAPAVRAARPRRRRDGRDHARASAPRAACRCPTPPGATRAALFRGFGLDDAGTLAEIRRPVRGRRLPGRPAYRHRHRRRRARRTRRTDAAIPVVALATAHPAKFPDAVEQATGIRPRCRRASPTYMSGRNASPVLPADLAGVEAFVRAHARRNAAWAAAMQEIDR